MKRWGVGGVKQRHLWTSRGPASELFFASTAARHRPSIERIIRRAWTIGPNKKQNVETCKKDSPEELPRFRGGHMGLVATN